MDKQAIQLLSGNTWYLPANPLRPVTPLGSGAILESGYASAIFDQSVNSFIPQRTGALGFSRICSDSVNYRSSVEPVVGRWNLGQTGGSRNLVYLGVSAGKESSNFQSSIPFIGWLLIAHTFVPSVPPIWSERFSESTWEMPPRIYGAAWVVMAAGYTYSGYTKLVSQSWIDGSALSRVLQQPVGSNRSITRHLAGYAFFISDAGNLGGTLS